MTALKDLFERFSSEHKKEYDIWYLVLWDHAHHDGTKSNIDYPFEMGNGEFIPGKISSITDHYTVIDYVVFTSLSEAKAAKAKLELDLENTSPDVRAMLADYWNTHKLTHMTEEGDFTWPVDTRPTHTETTYLEITNKKPESFYRSTQYTTAVVRNNKVS